MTFVSRVAALCAAAALSVFAAGSALALDKISFGTNWVAEAEHGGFFQAKADGTYEKFGLDVDLRPGGPQVNHSQLLAAGVIDLAMIANNAISLNFLKNDIPMVTVAAFFQKDPAALLTRPELGIKSIADLKGKPIMISSDTREGWWRFMRLKYGFTDDQIRPYNFQMAPFLVNKNAVQQAYITAEPYAIREKGVKPDEFLIADAGWPSYSTLVATSRKMATERRDVVQRFIDASIVGWYTYLYGDASKGNALIRQMNPEMSDGQIAYSTEKMREYGIVDSGDSNTLGIGAMTEKRLKEFFDLMVSVGVYDKSLNHMDAFDLSFVNRKVGMPAKK